MLTRTVLTFLFTFAVIYATHTAIEVALNNKGYDLRLRGSVTIYLLVSAALITGSLLLG